jgi:RNA polymerase sigma-70 factor (ECF subfamily)
MKEMRAVDNESIRTRLSLLSRLKDWNDQESWREFFDTYWHLIYGLALKCGLRDVEAQDVVQETMLSAAKQMPGFKYDPALGSFKGWLLQITRRRISDQFRKRQTAPPSNLASPASSSRDGGRTETVECIPDPAGDRLEKLWDVEWQRSLFQVALERVKRRVSPKQFQMFDLYVTQQWPMELIRSTLGVSAAQVYMAKMRVERLLSKEVKTLAARDY